MIIMLYLIIFILAIVSIAFAVKKAHAHNHLQYEEIAPEYKIMFLSIIAIVLFCSVFSYDTASYIYHFKLETDYKSFFLSGKENNKELLENAWTTLKFEIFQVLLFGIGLGGLCGLALQKYKNRNESKLHIIDIRVIGFFIALIAIGGISLILKGPFLQLASIF